MGRYYRRRNNDTLEILFKGFIYIIALPILLIVWIVKLSNKQKYIKHNNNTQITEEENVKINYNKKGKKYNFVKNTFLTASIILIALFIYFAYGLKLNGYACPITIILSICTIVVTAIFNKLANNETIEELEQEDIRNQKIEFMNRIQNTNIKIPTNQNNNSKYHIKQKTITDNEKYFLDIIKKHFGKNYDIRIQVPLSSIIEKEKDNEWEYQNELNRIIDIGIFNKETSYPLLLIEINDNTHHRKDRQVRDAKVKNICEQANIKLIAFWTKYSNTEEYIFNKVNNNLNR